MENDSDDLVEPEVIDIDLVFEVLDCARWHIRNDGAETAIFLLDELQERLEQDVALHERFYTRQLNGANSVCH